MGQVDLKNDSTSLGIISRALKARNLLWYEQDEWEVNGPHPCQNYQVFIGPAYFKKPRKIRNSILVKIVPQQGVWQVSNTDERLYPECRIRLGEKWN